jgi:CDP-diacylglycerol--glycerol-3-phosphate 3-phosphatidyltransferase
LLLTVFYVAAASLPGAGMATLALICFSVAAATDWLDGHLARKLNLVTSLGKLLDPLVDKILVCAAFLHMSVVGLCPMWITALIIAREFLVTGLRQIAIERGVVIAADRLGKWKTSAQITYLITGLVWLRWQAFPDVAAPWSWLRWLAKPDGWFMPITMYLSLFLTMLSGANYLNASRSLLSDQGK